MKIQPMKTNDQSPSLSSPSSAGRTLTTYTICDSRTGVELVRVACDAGEIESLSAESAEGHFRAGACDEIVAAGVDAGRSVFALV